MTQIQYECIDFYKHKSQIRNDWEEFCEEQLK